MTARVWREIRHARPSRLFVAADGPPDQATRSIVELVDWPCVVTRFYSDHHQGCREAVMSAITRAFEYVNRLIILEDDTVPHQSFFRYCTELLDRYEQDTRIMQVCGDNKGIGNPFQIHPTSYFFSELVHIWGWATWKRAWQLNRPLDYDLVVEMLIERFDRASTRHYWYRHAIHNRDNPTGTWDLQWILNVMLNNGLTCMPARNLVQNIGFDDRATHTKKPMPDSFLPTEDIGSVLVHPRAVYPERGWDAGVTRSIYGVKPYWKESIQDWIGRLLP